MIMPCSYLKPLDRCYLYGVEHKADLTKIDRFALLGIFVNRLLVSVVIVVVVAVVVSLPL